jgi:hypothetical protein
LRFHGFPICEKFQANPGDWYPEFCLSAATHPFTDIRQLLDNFGWSVELHFLQWIAAKYEQAFHFLWILQNQEVLCESGIYKIKP